MLPHSFPLSLHASTFVPAPPLPGPFFHLTRQEFWTGFSSGVLARLLALPAAAFAACAPELEDGSAFTMTMAANNKLARGVAVVGVVVDLY